MTKQLRRLNVSTLPPLAPRVGFEKDNEMAHVVHEMWEIKTKMFHSRYSRFDR